MTQKRNLTKCGVNNKLNVVVIASVGDPPYVGGIENVVETLIKSCLADSYEFSLFDTYRKPDLNRSILKKVKYAIGLCFQCGNFLIKIRSDIVHIHFCSNIDFWKHAICLFVSRLLRVKTVFHLHGGNFEKVFNSYHTFAKILVRAIFRMPHRVIALSEYWAAFLSHIVNPERLSIVNNSINCNRLSRPNTKQKDKNEIKILLLGRLGKHKGHYDALRALPIVIKKYPNILVLFAGPDEEIGATTDLKRLAKEYNVDSNVKFLGPITGNAKIELLHTCSIMILPSYGENMPLSVMEGMAAKLPIIATSVGAIPELLENGKLGILIDVGDYESLAYGIIRLLSYPTNAENFTYKAHKKIRDMYDIQKIAADVNTIYQEVINL